MRNNTFEKCNTAKDTFAVVLSSNKLTYYIESNTKYSNFEIQNDSKADI